MFFCNCVMSGMDPDMNATSGPSPLPAGPWHCTQLFANSNCPMLIASCAKAEPALPAIATSAANPTLVIVNPPLPRLPETGR